MQTFIVGIMLIALTGMTGCSHLFHPRSSEYMEKAKGPTDVDTVLNLIPMLEASAKASHGPDYKQPMDDLHNQYHALHDAFREIDKPTTDTPAYAKAYTIEKELWTIFKPLWWNQSDQALRNVHLDLFERRLGEFREALQALKH